MITVVVGKEIEKIKGDFESYLNGLNMVGEITYSQYSKLYDEGTKQIQKAYELGKSELEKENVELKTVKIPQLERKIASIRGCHRVDLEKLKARLEQVERQKQEIAELKAQIEKLQKEKEGIIHQEVVDMYSRFPC